MENNLIVESPSEIIKQAVIGGADLSKIRELLEIQKEWDLQQSKKIFAREFAAAQAEIEAVTKDKINPQTHSKYAPLEIIIDVAKPVYTAHGFAVIFYEGTTTAESHIRICVDILHEAGHKETYFYDVPLDGKGIKGNVNMTAIHAKASSVSYGRRYLMCMIWNIATTDSDGNATEQTVSENQLAELRTMLVEMGDADKESDFAKVLGVDKLDNLSAKSFQEAKTILQARAAKRKARTETVTPTATVAPPPPPLPSEPPKQDKSEAVTPEPDKRKKESGAPITGEIIEGVIEETIDGVKKACRIGKAWFRTADNSIFSDMQKYCAGKNKVMIIFEIKMNKETGKNYREVLEVKPFGIDDADIVEDRPKGVSLI